MPNELAGLLRIPPVAGITPVFLTQRLQRTQRYCTGAERGHCIAPGADGFVRNRLGEASYLCIGIQASNSIESLDCLQRVYPGLGKSEKQPTVSSGFITLELRQNHAPVSCYGAFSLQRTQPRRPVMFNKILCPTDGSDQAYKALDLAIDLAKIYDAELLILHVPHPSESIENLRRFAEIEGLTPHVNQEMDRLRSMDYRISVATDTAFQDSGISPRLLVEVGHHIVDRAKSRARQKGLEKTDTRIEVGNPADRILECINAEKIDCVIMGSRGLSDLKGMFLGSVSHKVANRAPCTCITVK